MSCRYDHQNRLISGTTDLDGSAGPAGPFTEYFIHDGVPFAPSPPSSGENVAEGRMSGSTSPVPIPLANPDAALVPSNRNEIGQIVLRLSVDGQVMNRYLCSDQVDQLLAQESVAPATSGPQSTGDVAWALTDHLGTIRDLVRYDAQSTSVQSILHRAYDSYGNVTSISSLPAAATTLFSFTGRLFDSTTGLQNNLNRWYDAAIGRWISEDPIGLKSADTNLFPYVKNRLLTARDASGLSPPDWLMDRRFGIGPEFQSSATDCDPGCVQRALNKSQFGNDVKNDHYKHCTSSCELHKACGTLIAGALGWGKEIWDVLGPGDADWGDIVANNDVREIGATGGDRATKRSAKYPPGQERNADPGWF